MKKILLTLFIIILFPSFGFSLSWDGLWSTANQQAVKLLQEHKTNQAADKFSNPLWKGYAYYKSGDYKNAAVNFSKQHSALANYNLGNALAHLGQYQSAIDAYNAAIQQQANNSDALYNKAIVEQLLRQSQKQKKNGGSLVNTLDSHPTGLASRRIRENNGDNKRHPHECGEPELPSDALDSRFPGNDGSIRGNDKLIFGQPQQAITQWLQQIPDNPGALLKQKFLRDHLALVAEKS